MVDVVSRDQIKQSLLAKADEMFAAWDTHDTVKDEPDKKYIAKQTFADDGNAITMVKWQCDGLTLEDLKQWEDDPTSIMCATNDRCTREALPDVDGQKMWHLKMNMPLVISNRSVSHASITTSMLKAGRPFSTPVKEMMPRLQPEKLRLAQMLSRTILQSTLLISHTMEASS